MKITQVRNATLIIDFGGTRFLVDPMLAEKGALPPFANTPNVDRRNPLVDLPLPHESILDVDAVIVTHMHDDHWDHAAKALVPKTLTIFAQNQDDAASIRSDGFHDVRVLSGRTHFRGIELTRTPGQHGSDQVMELIGARMGKVSGFVARYTDEPTLYVAGDTVWNGFVEDSLRDHQPEVVVLNCGDARIIGAGRIIMDAEDVLAVARAAPRATIIATHLEALNHCLLSRSKLRRTTEAANIAERVFIPADGETCLVPAPR